MHERKEIIGNPQELNGGTSPAGVCSQPEFVLLLPRREADLLVDQVHYGVPAPRCEFVAGSILCEDFERVRKDQHIPRPRHSLDVLHSDVCCRTRDACLGWFKHHAQVGHTDEARGTARRKASHLDRESRLSFQNPLLPRKGFKHLAFVSQPKHGCSWAFVGPMSSFQHMSSPLQTMIGQTVYLGKGRLSASAYTGGQAPMACPNPLQRNDFRTNAIFLSLVYAVCISRITGKRPSAGLNVSSVCRTGMSPRARRLAYLGAFPLGYPEVYITNSAFANTFPLLLLHQASTGRIDQWTDNGIRDGRGRRPRLHQANGVTAGRLIIRLRPMGLRRTGPSVRPVRFDGRGLGDVPGHDLGDPAQRVGVLDLVGVVELSSAAHVQV